MQPWLVTVHHLDQDGLELIELLSAGIKEIFILNVSFSSKFKSLQAR